MGGAAFQTYDFTLAAGGSIQIPASGEFFRIQTATGKLDVIAEFGALRGLGIGQGARSPFRILNLKDASGAANSGTIIVGTDNFVDNQIILATSSAIALDSATQNGIRQPLSHTGYWNDSSALTANVAVTVFLPSLNVNGALLLAAQISFADTSTRMQSFIAKATTPTSPTDGASFLDAAGTGGISTYWGCNSILPKEQFIPAGLGLYFIDAAGLAAASASTPNRRSCRYKLL